MLYCCSLSASCRLEAAPTRTTLVIRNSLYSNKLWSIITGSFLNIRFLYLELQIFILIFWTSKHNLGVLKNWIIKWRLIQMSFYATPSLNARERTIVCNQFSFQMLVIYKWMQGCKYFCPIPAMPDNQLTAALNQLYWCSRSSRTYRWTNWWKIKMSFFTNIVRNVKVRHQTRHA